MDDKHALSTFAKMFITVTQMLIPCAMHPVYDTWCLQDLGLAWILHASVTFGGVVEMMHIHVYQK